MLTELRLSPDFLLSEFTRSQTAARLGIENQPPETSLPAVQALVSKVLQPARSAFGRSMFISSGYRSPELNAVTVGSPSNSQHMWTPVHAAADVEIFGVDTVALAHWIEEHCSFDQLICEYVTPSEPGSGWVHVSYSVRNNRFDTRTKVRGNAFEPGLPS